MSHLRQFMVLLQNSVYHYSSLSGSMLCLVAVSPIHASESAPSGDQLLGYSTKRGFVSTTLAFGDK